MAQNRSDLEVRVTGRDDLSPQLAKIESKLIRFVGAVGAGIAAIRITTAPIRAAADLERELANVRKTTNFASQDIGILRKELLQLSTEVDVSAVDLAKIAAAAGQQGLGRFGVEGITKFTDSVARMSSVLDITAEKAAEDVGKIVNIFKKPLSDIEQVVSTFNEVSNNSTAKGEELLDVVKRIGDAAGTLNLSQSVALAATGLDFGQSPEVVGTAFAKVFTSLTQKAEDFGRLLNIKSTEWIPQLQGDGIAAFQTVLAKLRTLNAVDQQNTIVKLFGGGRIGALVNKLVQDTTDSVLKRNLQSALTGELGTSALQEQATVLNTFKSQGILTLNALTKAGIDATNQILPPLTKYAIQLREVIQSPGFNSFLNAVVTGLTAVTDGIAATLSAVASLNINWENLLPVITAIVGVKLAKTLVGWAASALGLGNALKLISTNAGAAATGLNSAATAAKSSGSAIAVAATTSRAARVADLLGYRELYDAIQRNKAAILEKARVEQDVASKQAALVVAQKAAESARAGVRNSRANIALSGQNVADQRAVLNRTVAAAAAEEAALQTQRQNRLLQGEQQHQARALAIEQAYQARKAEIQASGSGAGLRAAQAERRQRLAEEQASYERSVRGVEAYWRRRLAISAAGAKAASDAEKLAFVQTLNQFDAAVNQSQTKRSRLDLAIGNETNAANTARAATEAAAAVQKANSALTAQSALTRAAGAGWAFLTLALRTAGTVLVTVATGLLRIASFAVSAFAIVTIFYSIADALGLVDRFLPVLTKLTDFLGLTSEAKRRAAIENEAYAKTLKEEQDRIEALTKAYRDATKEQGGLLSKNNVDSLVTQASSSDSRDARLDATQQIINQTSGVLLVLDQENKKIQDGVGKNLATLEKSTRDAQLRLATLQAEATAKLATLSPGSEERTAAQARYNSEIGAATTIFALLDTKLQAARGSFRDVGAEARTAEINFNLLAKASADLFTPTSINLIDKYLVPLSEAVEKADRLKKIYQEANAADTKAQANLPADAKRDPSETAISALKALQDANAEVSKLKESFRVIVAGISALPGIPEAVKKSVQDTLAFMDQSTNNLKSIVALANKAGDAALTGTKAGINQQGPAQGTGTFDPKARLDAARRLTKARIELLKAENDAAANLTEEGIRQEQSATEASYQRGLLDLSTYYSRREKAQLENISTEIEQRRLDIKGINQEVKLGGLDAADKKRIDADLVRLNGQIAVLEERKKGIQAQTARDVEVAAETFSTGVLTETNKLAEKGLIPSTTVSRFTATLKQLRQTAKVELDRLRSEGKESVASAMEQALLGDAGSAALAPDIAAFSASAQQLEQTKQEIARLQQEGALTTFDAETQLGNAIRNALPDLQQLLVAQEQVRVLLSASGDQGSRAYQDLVIAIQSTRGQLAALATETDATARSVNSGLVDSLTNALTNVKFTLGSIKDQFLGFLRSVADQIKTVFARNLAESVVKGLGSSGTGGLGGLVGSLLGGGGSGKPSGTVTDPVYTASASGGGIPGLGKVASSTESTAKSLLSLPEKIGGFFGGLGKTFGGLIGTVVSFLSTGFAAVVSALFTTSAVQATAGAGGFIGLLATAATVAHTGGVVGKTALEQRLVAPEVFKNSVRYHTGGVAGLRPGEVPIIAQEGETIRTAKQEKDLQNRLANGGSGEGGTAGVVNVWVVTPDQQPPSVGPNDIIAVVTDNIARGGSIRKMVQQVQIGR